MQNESFQSSTISFKVIFKNSQGIDSGDEVIVLWFSFTGQYIPAGGSGNLLSVSFDVSGDAANGDVA